MRIAVNTKIISGDYAEAYRNFIRETFSRIVTLHPEHEFIFIADRSGDQNNITGPNVKNIVTSPPGRYPLLWKLWYDIKIPQLLRKQQADVFICTGTVCSLTAKIPQCLVIHDLAFLEQPSFFSRAALFFYKRYTPGCLQKAGSVAAVTGNVKKALVKEFNTGKKKIDVVFIAAGKIFQPQTEEVKAAVKNKYTNGREYFLYTGVIRSEKKMTVLLKAFSGFKKRQQSNMKLVLAGKQVGKQQSFKESLQHYKYRADVIVTGELDEAERSKLTGSAYAMVCPFREEPDVVPLLEAMQCRVPVIIPANSAMEEMAGGAALVVEKETHEDMADKMMRLYKDEKLRSDLIERGGEINSQFSWERTADLLWQSILKASHPDKQAVS